VFSAAGPKPARNPKDLVCDEGNRDEAKSGATLGRKTTDGDLRSEGKVSQHNVGRKRYHLATKYRPQSLVMEGINSRWHRKA